ncbi:putative inactive histone-lysine N-methyltransferase family member SUVH10 [Eutrema salsugineum]|uniref:putative inactive histone-lysine N-methyltransferase family member SUVH10 n=1 Tax=Eutrema salsugineum TaxID=72664 RepID=UPI000CED71D0|nr:putative inactive histone-lysine N-methyltransferase family member SUVH10 [Eutrema salsugineum]
MERGEGSHKFPGGEEPNTKNASNNDNSPADVGPSSGPLKRGRGRPKGSQNSKKSKQSDRLIKWVPLFQGSINKVNQETGNDELVSSLMMRFNAVRRRLSQVKNVRVPIGTNFMKVEDSGEEKRLAISVVSSGKNADEAQDPDSLIYTGFGGQESDQKLDRMNLSLEEALKKKSVVRVIRAVEDEKRSQGNVYIYDGLYSITEMWEEKSSSGFKVFKFRLVRQADQKPAFGLWKSIEQWKKELVTRPGLVLEDLSNGAENLKVSLVNEVDDEKGPSSFSYITSLKHTVIDVPPMVDLCTCRPKSCCSRDDFSEVISRPAIPFLISAKKSGNVARFMNHSCSPNVMWQPISREEKGVWCIHIGCFAIKHIPPLMELTYDYGAFTGYGKRKTVYN